MDAAALAAIGVGPPTPRRGVARAHLLELLQNMSRELTDIDLGGAVERVHIGQLDPIRFATEYVNRNKPVVILGAMEAWRAMRLWDRPYLEERVGDVQVTVDVTPNGRGDAVTPVAGPGTSGAAPCAWFVTPHERAMTLREFFVLLEETRARGPDLPQEVPYVQHQNSNLSEQFSMLLEDVSPGLPWAERVFGAPPEATNLWLGDDRSVTSFHKDHYENLYGVVRGTKIFTLLPPCDLYRLYHQRCPAARYVPDDELQPGQSHAAPVAPPGCSTLQASRPLTSGGREGLTPPPPAGQDGRSCDAETVLGTKPAAAADAEASTSCTGSSSRPRRLVAVLKDVPSPHSVVWSTVDTEAAGMPYGQRPAASTPPPPPPLHATSGSDGSGGAQYGMFRRTPAVDGSAAAAAGQEAAALQPLFYGSGLPPPLVAEVGPGEVLYLPAMWHHQVSQRVAPGQESVIAVNFWYDMKFDSRFAYFQLVEGLAQALGLAPANSELPSQGPEGAECIEEVDEEEEEEQEGGDE